MAESVLTIAVADKASAPIRDIESRVKSLEKSTQDSSKSSNDLMSSLTKIGLTAGAVGAVGTAIYGIGVSSYDAYMKNAKLQAQLQGQLVSNGNLSGKTLAGLSTQANELAKSMRVPVQAISEAQSELLKYGNIQGKTYDDVLKAALNMGKVTGNYSDSVRSIAQSISKIDPGPLEEKGIVMSVALKKQAMGWKETGDQQSYSQVVLDKVNESYGKVAETMNTEVLTASDRLKDSIDRLMATIGKPVAGGAAAFQNPLAGFVDSVNASVKNLSLDNDPMFQAKIADLAKIWDRPVANAREAAIKMEDFKKAAAASFKSAEDQAKLADYFASRSTIAAERSKTKTWAGAYDKENSFAPYTAKTELVGAIIKNGQDYANALATAAALKKKAEDAALAADLAAQEAAKKAAADKLNQDKVLAAQLAAAEAAKLKARVAELNRQEADAARAEADAAQREADERKKFLNDYKKQMGEEAKAHAEIVGWSANEQVQAMQQAVVTKLEGAAAAQESLKNVTDQRIKDYLQYIKQQADKEAKVLAEEAKELGARWDRALADALGNRDLAQVIFDNQKADQAVKGWVSIVQKGLSYIQGSMSSLSSVISQMQQNEANALQYEIDAQKQALDDWEIGQQRKIDIAKANGEDTTQMELDLKDKIYTKEKEIRDKERDAKKKAWEANKISQLTQAVMNGAQAELQNFATVPFPYSLVTGALIAGLTGVQIGLIASQPTPKFATGGFVPGTSYNGDRVNALVNSGEAILNVQQQKNFMDLANGNGRSGGLTIIIQGAIYGYEDFAKAVRQAFRKADFVGA